MTENDVLGFNPQDLFKNETTIRVIDLFINNIQKEEFDQYKKKFNTLY